MIPSIPTSYESDAHRLERIDWWVFFVWIDAREAQYRVACTMCDPSATLLNVHLGSIAGCSGELLTCMHWKVLLECAAALGTTGARGWGAVKCKVDEKFD